MSITKYLNEEEYDIHCAKLKENMILYINQFLHLNHWRINYPSDRYVMRYKKIKYRLSKKDKRCILIAFYLFDAVEYNKTLVDHVITDIFKLRN